MNNIERLISNFNSPPGLVRDRWLPVLRSLEVATEDKDRIIVALEQHGFDREWIAEQVAGAASGPAIDFGEAAMLSEFRETERRRASGVFDRRTASIDDFRFDVVQELFWCVYSGKLLGAKGINALVPQRDWAFAEVAGANGSTRNVRVTPANSVQRDPDLVVDGSTWWPGMPQMIRDMDVVKGALVPTKGAVIFNSYVPPNYEGLPTKQGEPTFWINHVKKLFPDKIEHEHFFDYAAHMIQKPEEKVNHGLVISGNFGIGKDTMLWPLRIGVGSWNVNEIDPDALAKDFNGYVQCVLLMVNEVRPHDDHARAKSFYNKNKSMLAAPPDVLPMELKCKEPIYIKNVLRAVFTTNDYLTMHIPDDDRRLFVMHSRLPARWAEQTYFKAIFDEFKAGGVMTVINWLKERDISKFDPTAPPPMTSGKKQVMVATKTVSRTVIHEAFDLFVEEKCGGVPPDVFFPKHLLDATSNNIAFEDDEDLGKALKSKWYHHAMGDLGYDTLTPEKGRWEWEANGKRVQSRVAFVKRSLGDEKRAEAINAAGRALVGLIAAGG